MNTVLLAYGRACGSRETDERGTPEVREASTAFFESDGLTAGLEIAFFFFFLVVLALSSFSSLQRSSSSFPSSRKESRRMAKKRLRRMKFPMKIQEMK